MARPEFPEKRSLAGGAKITIMGVEMKAERAVKTLRSGI
jgi:hypothetical protein